MITNEKKENMINEVVKRLGIKKTKIYPSKTNPIVPDDYNSLKGQIEENKKLKFEGLKLDNIRIVKDKEEIIAENCTFIDFQFRDFTCEKVVFINCMFVDFSLIGGTYPNIIFIACHFERLDVRNSCVSSLVDLTGMTMIRCSFGDGCRITGANISSSRWLETDINDLEIVRDLNSPQKCIINDYYGDDFRDKSEVEADVAETIKNIDINLLEKEIIRSKIYENEEVDIRMFINTDLFNCKFINCIFVSNDFEEAGLINYEMRLSIIKTHFYKCVFSCSLKGILFDGCKFEYPEFKGQLTYSTFDTCEFVDSTVTGSAIFSHTNFIDCNLSNLGSIIFGESQRVEELKKVAQKEHMRVEELIPLVAAGKVAICANKNHKCLDPHGVGSMLRTKINVNLGVSRDWKDYDIEMQKVMSAVNLGAEAIMDLSSHGNTQPFRQKLTHECPAMIGTVPVYDSVIHYQRDLATLTAQDFIDVVRLHAEDGVDFVTLHCGITRKTIEQIKKHKRKMNIVSRGGSLVFAWMCMTGEENPFYEHYDEILDICEEYDVTISLGDACRPGCLADATDVCQIEELVRLGELTKRAWDHNVQVMVEGPGHVPLDQVAANMKVQQSICMGAPFYVLGPLVTDIAPGYDHITAAIGGAVAAMSGAAFLCYVTPAEHLALPNVEDTKQGIIASKIAAHAADIAKGIPHARDIDDKMADARRVLDWDAQYACALDPETAKAIRDSRKPEDDHSDTCSMCGKFCAVRSMNKALAGEYIDIL